MRAAWAALALGFAGTTMTGAPALAQKKKEEAQPTGPKVSKAGAVVLQAIQKELQAQNWAGAKVALDAAEANPKLTADDRYYLNRFRINVAQGTQDYAALRPALAAAIQSPFVTAPEKLQFTKALRGLAYQANDLPEAVKWGEQLVALSPNDGQAAIELAQIYNQAKQPDKGYVAVKRAIDAQKASGQPVPEAWYRSAAATTANTPAMANEFGSATLAWVSAYPTPDNWRTVLELFQDRAKFDDQGNLDLFRLKRAASALKGEKDYVEYAETANLRGLPGEAKAVLDEGIAKKMLDTAKPYVRDLKAIVEPKVARDKASLAGLEKEAKAAPGVKLIAGLGDAYMGYGNYAKAIEMYRAALTKTGADAATLNTRIGIALAKSGDKAGAEAAFKSVQGGARGTLAQYWLAWLGQQA
jgi:tetratricopeptide (TPR) repeat protein